MPSATGSVFFVLWGAVLVFSMHGGFAFLEAGSVRRKNVADSLTRIITDWAISTVMYFAIGWPIAYGTWMYASAAGLVSANQGFNLVHFFFLLTFAACAPAIISGGISERVRSIPVMLSTVFIVALIYPFFESMVWGQLVWLLDLHRSDVGFAVERVWVCIGAVRYLHEIKHFCNGAASNKDTFSAAPNESHKLIFEYNAWFSQRERQRLRETRR